MVKISSALKSKDDDKNARAYLKWTEDLEEKLVVYFVDNYQEYIRSKKRQWHEKCAKELSSDQLEVLHTQVKNKLEALLKDYKRIKALSNASGFGIPDSCIASNIEDYLCTLFAHWQKFDGLLGNKENISPS